jgi:phosphoglycerate dehydrogenase-like enzyme
LVPRLRDLPPLLVTPGRNADAVVELALVLLLATTRHIHTHAQYASMFALATNRLPG